jgi:ornithine cyclodeaminase/alanine dehydrogenase-like protein (mu-crystallin family)
MRILRRDDVKDLLTPAEARKLMRNAFEALFAKAVSMPPRTFVKADRFKGSVAFMPAYVETMDAMGMKAIALFADNPSRFSLPTILGSMLLFEASTGRTLALMDAGPLTTTRTAAVSAIATEYLSREDARVAGFIGAGAQGRAHVAAIREVRQINKILVFDKVEGAARDLVTWAAKEYDLDARVGPHASDVVKDSDIVTVATGSRTPVLEGSWIREGTHLNVIGSGPAAEIDASTHTKANKIVVDNMDSVLTEAQDILASIKIGALTSDRIYAELCELIKGVKPGRQTLQEITLFRSLGLAIEDVAAAKHIYEAAIRTGRGQEVPFP